MATQVPLAAAVVVALVGLLLPLVSTLPQFDREPEFPPDADEEDIEPRFLTRGWPGNDVQPGRWQPDNGRPPFLPTTTRRSQRFFTTTTRRPTRRQQPTSRPELDWPPRPPQDFDLPPRPPQGFDLPPGPPQGFDLPPRPPQGFDLPPGPPQDFDWRPRPPQGPRRTMRPPTPSEGVQRTTSRPTTSRPTTRRPTTRRPTSSRPTMGRPTTSRQTTSRPTTNRPTTTRTTPPSAGTTAQDCNCPSTNEFNPVCGTDGVSYPNPGRLRCARDCGKSVSMYHIGNCVTTSTIPPSSSASRPQR